uniref:RING-type domain-containing protein n=1 Tax=Hyaloperonospora arabidopsidis (strain Emoy2) TaxID=559515 RepID=M4C1X1_HYAAE
MTKHIILENGRCGRDNCVRLQPSAVDRIIRSSTVQRRLRKMSEHFQPSSFSFMVQARLLCVGTSVVYRVSLSLSITSTCKVDTMSGLTTRNDGYTTQSSWVIAMSQTKFCGFYAHVQAILRDPIVTQYLLLRQKQLLQVGKADKTVEWKPFETFLQVVANICQHYEHLQVAAFAIQATTSTMHARKIELEAFLLDCWRALEAVIPVLVVHPFLHASLGNEALCMYRLIRDLFSLPENVLDANCTYANAILSLNDVDGFQSMPNEQSCSICLDLLVSSAPTRLFDRPASHCDDSNSNSSSDSITDSDNSSDDGVADLSTVVSHSTSFSVKLPCGHVYHENCAMSWLRHNPSCPECRAPVGASS